MRTNKTGRTGKATAVLRLISTVLVGTLLVGCKPTISFTALQTTIAAGADAQLDWEVEFANGGGDSTLEIKPDIGVVDLEGSITITPDETTTYTLHTRSMVYGFPMFVQEEVTIEVADGDFWDFTDLTSNGVGDWSFDSAGYPENDKEAYNVVSGKQEFGNTPINSSAIEFSSYHEDSEDNTYKIFTFGKVRKGGLEDNTAYNVVVSTVYKTKLKRSGSSQVECDEETPIVALSAYTLLEEPTVNRDVEDDSPVLMEGLGEPTLLATDITLTGECDDEDYEKASASETLSITTDSDGEAWLVIAVESAFPDFEVYITSVTAIFSEVE